MRSYLMRVRRALSLAAVLVSACTSVTEANQQDGGGTTGTQTGGAANTPSSLFGSWVYGTMSLTDYYNASTGAYIGNGYGTSVLFKFTSDGRYEQTVYISSTVYSCRTDIFVTNEGKVKFDGAQFRVYPTKGRVRSSDTCNAASNYDRADDIARKQGDRYSWAFEPNAIDGKTYLMIGVDGAMTNRSSFRKAD
jgi:hypothetical protein